MISFKQQEKHVSLNNSRTGQQYTNGHLYLCPQIITTYQLL